MKRILFHPANFGVATNNAALRHKASLPLRASGSLAALKCEIRATTLNVGNIVHNEAVAKSFEIDRTRSCLSSIEHLYVTEYRGKRQDFRAAIQANFDAVVFSYANMISPPAPGRADAQQRHMERLCEVVDALPVPVYVFGMGMQEALDSEDRLVPAMRDLLRLFDKKATIFGVRGDETEAFLHNMGCTNAVALGCPSLYVYPGNILKTQPRKVKKRDRLLTAGYLGLRNLRGYQPERVEFLRALASRYTVNYVFQNDIYSYHELGDVAGLYDDATGRCDAAAISLYMQACGVAPIPFEGMWHFRDARSWRQLAEAHDCYFGDRFHGGVVALQASRPSLFVYKDLRVRELTNHFGIPNVALEDVRADNLKPLLRSAFSKERTEEMRDRYADRLREYRAITAKAGLSLTSDGVMPSGTSFRGEWRVLISRVAHAAVKTRPHTGKTGTPERLMKRQGGSDALRSDAKITAAITLFDRKPASVMTLELVLRALLEGKRLNAADKCLNAFLDEAGTDVMRFDSDACFRVANLFHTQQRQKTAQRLMDHLFSRKNQWPENYVRLYANILLADGQPEAASVLLARQINDGEAGPATMFQQARASLATGHARDALQHAEAALANQPNDALHGRILQLKAKAESIAKGAA
ncbi:polysaccharide pyruvyl transferase family protein [Kordiimonas sp.]|uniref:polysaccharide pyruvyl transferase family protein n=1 Tax=Kordiimonas sp. TaxID=1970157 RepID=UPI003A8EECC5